MSTEIMVLPVKLGDVLKDVYETVDIFRKNEFWTSMLFIFIDVTLVCLFIFSEGTEEKKLSRKEMRKQKKLVGSWNKVMIVYEQHCSTSSTTTIHLFALWFTLSFILIHSMILWILWQYRRIPIITAPVIFGFSSPKGPLLSGGRYFRVAVTFGWLENVCNSAVVLHKEDT